MICFMPLAPDPVPVSSVRTAPDGRTSTSLQMPQASSPREHLLGPAGVSQLCFAPVQQAGMTGFLTVPDLEWVMRGPQSWFLALVKTVIADIVGQTLF